MKVAFCIPTANPNKCGETFARWKALGYTTYVLIDGDTEKPANADRIVWVEQYSGYAASVNMLAHLAVEDGAEIVVTGGDDVLPVPHLTAQEIGKQFKTYFPDLLGIMEPTGDRHMVDKAGKCAAERVCIAPWMGAEFVRKWNHGKGPLDERFYHFWVDEALKRQVEACGLLWQRPDLIQYHDHWTRHKDARPYLVKAQAKWKEDERKFREMEAAGFPSEIEHYIGGANETDRAYART